MTKFVAVEIYNEISIHLPDPTGSWHTLCGIDGDDPHKAVQQKAADVPHGAKVNCRACYRIWKTARRYRQSDFAPGIEK